jgi:hypothetical protein
MNTAQHDSVRCSKHVLWKQLTADHVLWKQHCMPHSTLNIQSLFSADDEHMELDHGIVSPPTPTTLGTPWPHRAGRSAGSCTSPALPQAG